MSTVGFGLSDAAEGRLEPVLVNGGKKHHVYLKTDLKVLFFNAGDASPINEQMGHPVQGRLSERILPLFVSTR